MRKRVFLFCNIFFLLSTGIWAEDIFKAIENNHRDVIALYLKEGGNPNAVDRSGLTLIFTAIQYENLWACERLMEAKANPHTKMKDGLTTLIFASRRGNPQIVKFLIAHSVDVNAKWEYGRTALMEAVMRLQSKQLTLNMSNNKASGKAAQERQKKERDYLEIVRLMLGGRADVNAKDDEGETALTMAAFTSVPEVAQVLIDAHADVNARTKSGLTTLMKIANYPRGNIEVAKILIKAKADLNIKDEYYGTALQLASSQKKDDLVKLLKQAGAK